MGRLIVTVKNQGTAAAGVSVTRVEFFLGGVFDLPAPAIPAGDFVDLVVAIPPVCFDPQCDFCIKADANLQVDESDEGNNLASGSCSQRIALPFKISNSKGVILWLKKSHVTISCWKCHWTHPALKTSSPSKQLKCSCKIAKQPLVRKSSNSTQKVKRAPLSLFRKIPVRCA
ncbi:hypothetical protein HUU05_04755 [candidate division KSB1 bacterium]|nr:hypothetical protein [candidate division KSB1 bacterium]